MAASRATVSGGSRTSSSRRKTHGERTPSNVSTSVVVAPSKWEIRSEATYTSPAAVAVAPFARGASSTSRHSEPSKWSANGSLGRYASPKTHTSSGASAATRESVCRGDVSGTATRFHDEPSKRSTTFFSDAPTFGVQAAQMSSGASADIDAILKP